MSGDKTKRARAIVRGDVMSVGGARWSVISVEISENSHWQVADITFAGGATLSVVALQLFTVTPA